MGRVVPGDGVQFLVPAVGADSKIFQPVARDQVSAQLHRHVKLVALGSRKDVLDDFGSGFCSFSQLKNLLTDYVKIDGQFVRSMARGATDRAIVTAMNDVAHSLGRYTVAEYVESPEVVRLLKICGVDKIQGNYISVPLTELPNSNWVECQQQNV